MVHSDSMFLSFTLVHSYFMFLSTRVAHSNILFLSKTMIHSRNMLPSIIMVRFSLLFLSCILAHSKFMLLSTYDDSLDDYVSIFLNGSLLRSVSNIVCGSLCLWSIWYFNHMCMA
nr:MAG TPA: hypothetical protein [Caudoviricetes sp.]